MNNHWLDEVEYKLKNKNELLFNKSSSLLLPLILFMESQKRTTLILWAFDCASPIASTLCHTYSHDLRPQRTIDLCKMWAQGHIKMPLAKKAILSLHGMAKEVLSPADKAFCHAIAQGCSTVHVKSHAIGLVFYELTALVHLWGVDNCLSIVEDKVIWYTKQLAYWQEKEKQGNYTWADFLLKN